MKLHSPSLRLLAPAAMVVLATGLLGALGYAALFAITGGKTSHPLGPDTPDELRQTSHDAVTVLPTRTAEQQQTDQTIAALIDKLEATIARGETPRAILNQMATLESGASLEGLRLVIGMRERFWARAQSAAAAGRTEEAERLKLFARPQAAPTEPAGRSEGLPRAAPAPRGQVEAAVQTDRRAIFPSLALSAMPKAIPGETVKTAPLGRREPAAAEASNLPALAPVRVVLAVAGRTAARAKLAFDVKQELDALGVEVASVATVPAPTATPGIGYYFHADRDAAARICQRLEPLLGSVDPVALRIEGSVPQPGTVEITIP